MGWLLIAALLGIDQLESAIHKEMVLGDLPGAVADYRTFLAHPDGKTRAQIAQAMLQLAQCQEKLGDRNAAQRTYMRLSRDYADQAEVAAEARAKLFHWMEPVAGPRNLAFEKGEPGRVPPGWFSHSAEWTRMGCRSRACVVVRGPSDPSDAGAGAISQTFTATAYRGRPIRLRAWLRVDSADPLDRAQMWIRVERTNRQTGFFNDMSDRPVRSQSWTRFEIAGEVDDDAQSLTLGVMVSGSARVWVDGVSFEAESDSDPETLRARATLEKIYATEARAVLKSVRLNGADAIVTGRSEDASKAYSLRDTWTRSGTGWRLASSKITSVQPRARPTSPEEARAVAAELRERAVPLAIIEGGHTYYDLAADGFASFGKSVEDARLVVFGGGDGELRSRLTRYLIAEKGFVNIDADSPDEDLARWVRAFNNSRHANVKFSKSNASKTVMWADNDTAARLRGSGVLSIGFLSRDEVIAGAQLPMFFLDMRHVSEESALGRWLAAAHAFEADRVEILSKSYDALVYVEAIP